MSIGDIIRVKRLEKKMSQDDLAKALGKTKNVVSNWERGDNSPDVNTVAKICDILDISPNYLLGFSDESETTESTEIHTLAAHHEGEDWTEEELEDLEMFKELIRQKRLKRKGE